MQFRKYQHIEKLGSSEVEGILQGEVYVFYKIDGTNSCIWKDGNDIKFGSRNRELSDELDNAGFKHEISNNKEIMSDLNKFFELYPNYIIYGEWLVPHTLKTYNDSAWKKLYVFDIYDTEHECYVPFEEYSKLFDNVFVNIKYIPLLEKLQNPTIEELKDCLQKTGSFLVTNGLGEGIVIKNYYYRNKYGRMTWAKMLTEDFSTKKQKTRSNNKEIKDSDNKTEYEISKLMTIEHIAKEKSKIMETHGDWSDKYIFELLNRSFNEFFRDNWEIILKKFHQPTINFKMLKTLCDNRVKEYLANQKEEL